MCGKKPHSRLEGGESVNSELNLMALNAVPIIGIAIGLACLWNAVKVWRGK